MSYSSTYTTRLGDTVHQRFDDDGNEHVTLEVKGAVVSALELLPEPSGLNAFAQYRRQHP